MNIVTTFTAALLYTAIAIGANQAAAEENNLSHLESLRSGDMRKLVITGNTPVPSDLGGKIVLDENGNEIRFATLLAGRPVLINFWATWCAPCRKEMPSLDALAASFPSQDFAVLPVATGKNSVDDILAFFRGHRRVRSLHTAGSGHGCRGQFWRIRNSDDTYPGPVGRRHRTTVR